MAVFALFVAGLISLLLQDSVIKADTASVISSMPTFTADLATSSSGITVAVGAVSGSEECVAPSAGRWRVVVQNDTLTALDNVALRFQVEGVSESGVQLVDYRPQWQTKGRQVATTLYLGEMSGGQVNTFFLDIVPSGDAVTVAASASDDSGFVYDTWAGQELDVDERCLGA